MASMYALSKTGDVDVLYVNELLDADEREFSKLVCVGVDNDELEECVVKNGGISNVFKLKSLGV